MDELSQYLDNEIMEGKQRFIDIHDLVKAMDYNDYMDVLLSKLPVIVKGSKGLVLVVIIT